MNSIKFVRLFLFVILFALPVSAQEPAIEYGNTAELRGVSKIFVDTGSDIRQRDLIAKAIQKRLPNLEIASRPEESNVHLRFTTIQTKDGNSKEIANVVKLVSAGRVRILYSVNDLLLSAVERQSLTDFTATYAKPYLFAVEFIKAYKKANGESKT